MPPSNKKQRNVLLDPADDHMLVEFCRLTKRDIPETMRHIVKLFLQDGMQAASDRLNTGLWDLVSKAPSPGALETPPTIPILNVPGSTPEEKGTWVLQGKTPADESASATKPA